MITTKKIKEMKKEKFFNGLESFLKGLSWMSIAGIVMMLFAGIYSLWILKGANQMLDTLFIVGSFLFILLPFFGQFAGPAGLLDEFGARTNIPLVGKIIIFLFVFPFTNMWLLITVDAVFNFLPDFREALIQGKDPIVVQALKQEYDTQFWAIVILTCFLMIGAGFLFRKIFMKKIQKKFS